VDLVETLLPDFELPRAVADLVVFAFPNMEDVYHQSKNRHDKHGGYFITVLRAL